MNDLWFGTKGPPDAPIVFVAESWGAEEQRAKKPLVGSSGVELDRMLARAGIDASQILFTNVVAAQPQANETWRFFLPKAGLPASEKRLRGLAPNPLVRSEVQRLYSQIAAHPRRLVIAAGNYALWALSACTTSKVLAASNNRKVPLDMQTWAPSGIQTWRGSMLYTDPIPELGTFPQTHLLPVIHPAGIMRAWYLREPTIHDLRVRVPKALRNDWRRRPEPIFLAPPTFLEAKWKLEHWLAQAGAGGQLRLACDIETKKPIMTCIGFADGVDFAMSIPFVRKCPTYGLDSYWTPAEEAELIWLIRRVLTHPRITIDGQNFIYDTQYIQRWLGFTPRLDWDTMLNQNVLFPGTPKALDYLASMYCDYYWYWKEDSKEWDTKGTLEQMLQYNCQDLVNTWEIGAAQRQLTHSLGQEAQMDFKMQTNALCLRMMNRGVLFDVRRRGPLLFDLQEKLAGLERELLEIIPQEWIAPPGKRAKAKGGGNIYWFTSDKQQKFLFYDFLGFKPVKDPKTGNLTVGKKALGQFLLWYPEFTGLISRLKTHGSLGTSINVIKMKLGPDGRVNCSYNPAGTETHRLSSSTNVFDEGTNLQNLSKGEEDE
jgi:uracil-DNA glycosylase